jgi:hypothetical protein
MLKEMGYQEKIEILAPWLEEIIEVVKKDLKNEHLKIDRQFCKKHFFGKQPSHLQAKEMAAAYRSDIAGGNVGLGEFIATRWLLKNTDIYGYFEEKIKGITVDFETLEQLPHELSVSLMNAAVKIFGAKRTYLFSVFNSVVFPASVYNELKEMAIKETDFLKEEEAERRGKETLEGMQLRHSREMAALTDKYEKKLSGLQKKYLQDTESLKKQLSSLQKKLQNG